MPDYYVYIMTNNSGTLYTGVTNDLERRVAEHRAGTERGFAAKYKTNRLMYYEATPRVEAAIAREKQIKSWRRSKKIELIQTLNPRWRDLAQEWYEDSGVAGEGPDPSLRSG